MLFEGTLVLVAGGAWLRVGSMMATDLSERRSVDAEASAVWPWRETSVTAEKVEVF